MIAPVRRRPAADATSPVALEPPLLRGDGSRLRVLVVDDETDLLDVLASVLRSAGYDVRTAATGAQAVSAAVDFVPDAVILDVMLPDLDGLGGAAPAARGEPVRVRPVPHGARLRRGPRRGHRPAGTTT